MTIYFTPEWQQLFAEREGYPLERVFFTGVYGNVEYAFLKRPIEIKGEQFDYVDIVTPYAFAGPLLKPAEDTEQCRKALASEFDVWFQNYCTEHKIVAEYVQFCPFSKNHLDFANIYETSFRTTIVALDVAKEDILMEEIESKRRTRIRKAMKLGVQAFFDFDGEKIDSFLEVYQNTIEKHDVSEYYQIDSDFLRNMFSALPGRAFIAYTTYEDKIASIALCVRYEKYVHGFLIGHDPELNFTNSSSFLTYAIACKAKELGAVIFDTGGAAGQLMEYKKSFTKNGFYEYCVGKKIRNAEVYNMLMQKNGVTDTSFFPAYRDHRS